MMSDMRKEKLDIEMVLTTIRPQIEGNWKHRTTMREMAAGIYAHDNGL